MNKSSVRSAVVVGLIAIVAVPLFTASAAKPQKTAGGCTPGGVNLQFMAFRADGLTPVGAGSVIAGETIKYRAVLSHLGGSNCNFSGGDLDIITPDSVIHDVDGGAIPTVSPTSQFTSAFATYLVDPSDVVNGFVDAQAIYFEGVSQTQGKDTLISANQPLYIPFQKLDPAISVQVHNAAHTAVSSVPQGTAVHGQVTLGAAPTGSIPTGTAYFRLTWGTACQGDLIDGGNLPLDVNGQAESPAIVLAAGDYSYLVSYYGDLNYNSAAAACLPFSVL